MKTTLRRFWIRVTSDRKRFGILVGVVLVGLLLWGRIIVVSNPPRRAVADDSDPITILSGQGRPDSKVGASDNYVQERVSVILAVDPARDPFRISPKHFPKPTADQKPVGEVVELAPNPADEREAQEARRTAVLKGLAERLSLEAVMKGGPAVIDGRTVSLGGEFKADSDGAVVFTLVEIGTRSVIVEAEGRRFELRMTSVLRSQ